MDTFPISGGTTVILLNSPHCTLLSQATWSSHREGCSCRDAQSKSPCDLYDGEHVHSPRSEGNHLPYEEHKHVFLALCKDFICKIAREEGDPRRSPNSRLKINKILLTYI